MSAGVIGLLCIFLTPMVFGGITMYYSQKEIEKETIDRWKRQGYNVDDE